MKLHMSATDLRLRAFLHIVQCRSRNVNEMRMNGVVQHLRGDAIKYKRLRE